jgi:hypothetical protein
MKGALICSESNINGGITGCEVLIPFHRAIVILGSEAVVDDR